MLQRQLQSAFNAILLNAPSIFRSIASYSRSESPSRFVYPYYQSSDFAMHSLCMRPQPDGGRDSSQAMTTKGRSIYLDISDLFDFARHMQSVSGIQRFELRMAAQIIAHHQEAHISLIAYHPAFEQVLEVSSSWCTEDFAYDQSDFTRTFGLNLRSPSQFLEKYKKNQFRYIYHLARLMVFASIQNRKFFQKRNIRSPFSRPSAYNGLLKPV